MPSSLSRNVIETTTHRKTTSEPTWISLPHLSTRAANKLSDSLLRLLHGYFLGAFGGGGGAVAA